MLGSPIDPLTVSQVIRRFVRQQSWNDPSLALTRLADHLDGRPVIIDYGRRRALNYEDLLPGRRWQEILAQSAAPAGLTRLTGIARSGLFRRISGIQHALPPPRTPSRAAQQRSQQAQFRRLASSETLAALEREAEHFLADQGITGEPIAWSPPLHLLDGLRISGTDRASKTIPCHTLSTPTDSAPTASSIRQTSGPSPPARLACRRPILTKVAAFDAVGRELVQPGR
jgi:hypothetical protein